MAKKTSNSDLEALLRLSDQLDGFDELLSDEERREVLRAAGCDPEGSWHRFLAKTKRLESDLWAAHVDPPAALRRLAKHAETHSTSLSSRAKLLLADLSEKLASRVALPADLHVLRAYRKSGNLSTEDALALDALEQELKAQVVDTKPSGE